MGASQPDSRPAPGDARSPRPRLAVEVVCRVPAWHGHAEETLLEAAARAAFEAGGGAGVCELSLLLSDDDEIRALNRSWRGKDEATNVLSFPLDAPDFGAEPRILGDVALAFETVAREAGTRGIAVGQHAAHLVIHGVLHLLGHDHPNDARAGDMEALETRIMAGLGLPDPYALGMMTSGEEQ